MSAVTSDAPYTIAPGILMPTMAHQFQLGEWGSPSKHFQALRNQLSSIEINYKENDVTNKYDITKEVVFIFEDDSLGLVANAIDAFTGCQNWLRLI